MKTFSKILIRRSFNVGGIFFLFVFFPLLSNAQHAAVRFSIPKTSTVEVSSIKEDWNQQLISIEHPDPDGNDADQIRFENMKDSLENIYVNRGVVGYQPTTANKNRSVDSLYVWRNFKANLFGSGTPNDNDIAISNGGKIISVMNSSLYFYDYNTDTTTGTISLQAFSTSLGNSQSKYDPKVIYDEEQDKFIVVYLAGYTHSTSTIVVAFSQTNDPTGAWNFYQLPGNPLNDTLWSDFPMVSLTQHELFITINHIHDNLPWQTAFVHTAIWQVNKFDGYIGDTLSTALHTNTIFDSTRTRNVCPVKGGSQLYNDMYFLSERNFAAQNDSIFFLHINDTIGGSADTLSVAALIADNSYFVPVNGKEPGVIIETLATNDSRVLGAFYENDQIQFVGNTTDTSTGKSAIYHGIISNVSSSPSVHLEIVSDDSLSLGYPNISYLGNSATDNRSVITFLSSSKTVFPGFSMMSFDGAGNYSPLKNIHNGESFYNIIAGDERWGDYSGSQRKYNEPEKIWVNGLYATIAHRHNTWIAEISTNPIPAAVSNVASTMNATVFPNPSIDFVTVKFTMNETDNCHFEIYDVNGKLVKVLLDDLAREGENQFSFSTQPLAAGEYFLRISSIEKILVVKKVVKN